MTFRPERDTVPNEQLQQKEPTADDEITQSVQDDEIREDFGGHESESTSAQAVGLTEAAAFPHDRDVQINRLIEHNACSVVLIDVNGNDVSDVIDSTAALDCDELRDADAWAYAVETHGPIFPILTNNDVECHRHDAPLPAKLGRKALFAVHAVDGWYYVAAPGVMSGGDNVGRLAVPLPVLDVVFFNEAPTVSNDVHVMFHEYDLAQEAHPPIPAAVAPWFLSENVDPNKYHEVKAFTDGCALLSLSNWTPPLADLVDKLEAGGWKRGAGAELICQKLNRRCRNADGVPWTDRGLRMFFAELLRPPVEPNSSLGALTATTRPRVLIDGLAEVGVVTAICGPPNTGKTTLVLDAMIAAANGMDYLGWTIPKGVGSILVGSEDATEIIQGRSEAFMDHHNLNALGSVHLLSKPEDGRWIWNESLERRIEKLLRATGCEIVVIDPLHEFLGVDSEDDNAAVLDALQRIRSFAQRNEVGVICVAHPSKSSKIDNLYSIRGGASSVGLLRGIWNFWPGKLHCVKFNGKAPKDPTLVDQTVEIIDVDGYGVVALCTEESAQ